MNTMNPRILELVNQSMVEHQFEHKFSPEKFAELIVRECANVALEQKKWVEDMIVFNRQDEQWNLARIQQSQRIVDKIREHFGVEE